MDPTAGIQLFFKDFKYLLKIKQYYPEELQPTPGTVYRGIRYPEILKPTEAITYKPEHPLQSWTYNLEIAMQFSLGVGDTVPTSKKTWAKDAKIIMNEEDATPIILKTKVTDNFLFNPNYSGEEETVRVSKSPLKVEIIHPLL